MGAGFLFDEYAGLTLVPAPATVSLVAEKEEGLTRRDEIRVCAGSIG